MKKAKLLLATVLIGMCYLSKAQTVVRLDLPNPCQSQDIQKPQNSQTSLELKIFPNPNKGRFNVRLKSDRNLEVVNVKIYNLQGAMVYELELYCTGKELMKTLNLEHLPDGVYLIQTQSKTSLTSKKLIIQ